MEAEFAGRKEVLGMLIRILWFIDGASEEGAGLFGGLLHRRRKGFVKQRKRIPGRRSTEDGVFLSRLSRWRFISRSHKINGEIVSKILTAHLGEHVLLYTRRYLFSRRGLQRIRKDPRPRGLKTKLKGWKDGPTGWQSQRLREEKKFSSYPSVEDAVLKLV